MVDVLALLGGHVLALLAVVGATLLAVSALLRAKPISTRARVSQ